MWDRLPLEIKQIIWKESTRANLKTEQEILKMEQQYRMKLARVGKEWNQVSSVHGSSSKLYITHGMDLDELSEMLKKDKVKAGNVRELTICHNLSVSEDFYNVMHILLICRQLEFLSIQNYDKNKPSPEAFKTSGLWQRNTAYALAGLIYLKRLDLGNSHFEKLIEKFLDILECFQNLGALRIRFYFRFSELDTDTGLFLLTNLQLDFSLDEHQIWTLSDALSEICPNLTQLNFRLGFNVLEEITDNLPGHFHPIVDFLSCCVDLQVLKLDDFEGFGLFEDETFLNVTLPRLKKLKHLSFATPNPLSSSFS